MASAATTASRTRPVGSERAAAGGVVIACGDPNRPGSIPSQMHWVLLVVSLFVILAGAELFTNGIEWIGEGFGLSEGAVGSVLAAVGTALPETLLPIIAIVSGHDAGQDIGVGAILGAPFMLTTLAMVVVAVAGFIFGRGGRRPLQLDIDRGVIRQDLGYFLVMYSLAVVAGLLHSKPFDYGLVIVLMVGYVYYVRRHFQTEGSEDAAAGEDIKPLYVWRWLELVVRSLQAWTKDGPTAAPFVQVGIALGLIILGAEIFVDAVTNIGTAAGIPPLAFSLLVAPLATELPEKFNS